MATATTVRILIVRVGWLDYYDDRRDETGPLAGGAYNTDEVGSEANNFRVLGDGRCYGYARAAWERAFNLRRVDPKAAGDSLDDCLVISVARAYGRGPQVVVGWHATATIHAEYLDRPNHAYGVYNFSAAHHDCVLLPPDLRTWEVPKGRGALGQSNVFYTREPDGRVRRPAWLQQVRRNVEDYAGPNLLSADPLRSFERALDISPAAGQGWGLTAAERRAVEDAAMRRATAHFQKLGYRVEDVHLRAPYDLYCTKNGESFRVEVKGTTGTADKILLTRNEVALAKDGGTALFVLSNLRLQSKNGDTRATGGTPICINPWIPNRDRLEALTYAYRLP